MLTRTRQFEFTKHLDRLRIAYGFSNLIAVGNHEGCATICVTGGCRDAHDEAAAFAMRIDALYVTDGIIGVQNIRQANAVIAGYDPIRLGC